MYFQPYIMNLEKFKKTKYYEFTKDKYFIILIGFLIIQINLLLLIFLSHKGSFILNIAIFMLSLLLFIFFKDEVDIKMKEKSFKILKISLPLFVSSMVNTLISKGINKLEGNELANGLIMIMFFFTFAIFILSISLYQKEEIKKSLDLFYNNPLFEEEEDTEVKYGDAVIGYKVEENGLDTEKPVILPFKDRFLHLLCIGPTGSGKTSQSIIPMIDRDLQYDGMGVIVIEPKGDLAEKVYQMAKHYNKNVLYFNPTLASCPCFNPLFGDETDVIENIVTTFKTFSIGSSQFFLDQNEILTRNALKVIKRLKGDEANFLDLDDLLNNTNGKGKKMIIEFQKLTAKNLTITRENEEIASYFLHNYFPGIEGGPGTPKTFEHTSGVRTQVSKLIANKFLRRTLNPTNGKTNEIDFDKALADGDIICISTAQGKLRDLGKFLGYFVILQLQASVFRRPGTEDTRRACMLYIDEFQEYTNPSFGIMLTQGRSYRVSCNLATQARDQITMGAGNDGEAFLSLVSANARNVIVYPGVCGKDADYYSNEFGTRTELKKKQTKSYDSVLGMKSGLGNKVSESIDEEETELMSPTRIRYRDFGYITHSLVKNNTLQKAGVSKIKYIDYSFNKKLNEEVEKYRVEQEELEKILDMNENVENKTSDNHENDCVVKNEGEGDVLFDIEPTDNLENLINGFEADFAEGEGAKIRNDDVKSNDYYNTGNSKEFNINYEDSEDDII